MSSKKPELVFMIDGKHALEMDLDEWLDLFHELTGREPTPEDIEDAKRELALLRERQ